VFDETDCTIDNPSNWIVAHSDITPMFEFRPNSRSLAWASDIGPKSTDTGMDFGARCDCDCPNRKAIAELGI